MAQPSQTPDWNTGGANRVDPPSGQKTSGWTVNQAPPSSYFNWWMNLVYQWVVYLKNLTTEALTWTPFQTFNSGLRGYGNNVNPGIRGDSGGSGFAGVRGHSAFSGAGEHGVLGTHGVGTGVKGEATSGNGVNGSATSGSGVRGDATTGIAVRGESTSGAGAYFSGSTYGVLVSSPNTAISASNASGPGGVTKPAVYAVGGGPAGVNEGRPGIYAEGGGSGDPADDQSANSAAAIVAKGGIAAGSSEIAPAIANVNAGPAIIATGGDVQAEFNEGAPGAAIIATGGGQVDPGFGGAVGGTALIAVGGTADGGKGFAIDADGVIKCNDAVKLVGSNIGASVAQINQLTPGLLLKAWAKVRVSSGTYTILAGQNFSSAVANGSIATGGISLNLATEIARTTRGVLILAEEGNRRVDLYDTNTAFGASDTKLTMQAMSVDTSGNVAALNLASNTINFTVLVLGLQ